MTKQAAETKQVTKPQLLIYEDVKPISKEKHKDLCVKTGSDYSFAKEVNSVPLMAIEFIHAAAEYPIVFAGDTEKVTPVVIMGTSAKENLFIKDENWDAKYIPAFIRRYPFIFASPDDGKTLTLCIDEKFDGCNTQGKGERLFDDDGERTQFLENTLKFLENYQIHHQRTQIFCKKLVELELLEPMQARIAESADDKKPKNLTGFWGVKRDKLKSISEENVQQLFKNDGLELIYLHLHSLRNFLSIVEKAAV